MGACYDSIIIEASSIAELKKKFRETQDSLLYEYGHNGYSGTLGECNGLKVVNKTFTERREADDWIADNAEKWEEALAIEIEEGKYLVGGICSE
jgi:hypothetical protein